VPNSNSERDLAESLGDPHRRLAWQDRLTQRLPSLATAFCVAFGLAMIANTQLPGDGGWYWYAVLHHAGQRLYRDLHLVLQPFAVLETEWWVLLTGRGWIVSKVPAVLHLLAFSVGIALVAAKTRLKSVPRAVLIVTVFFAAIRFDYYRFDDYHVIVDAIFPFSILLLLHLGETPSYRSSLKTVLALGILSGIAITTRFTDGVSLALAIAFAIAYSPKPKKAALLAAFCCLTSLVVYGIVLLTGDSLHDYVACTIFGAAGAKGGLVNTLLRPWMLILEPLSFLAQLPAVMVVLYCAIAAASWTWLISPFSRTELGKSVVKAALGAALFVGAVIMLLPAFKKGELIVVLSGIWVEAEYFLMLLLVVSIVLRVFRVGNRRIGDPNRVLLFLPFGLLLTGSLSTGGFHFGLYAPLAFFALLAAVLFPAVLEKKWLLSCVLVIAMLTTASNAYFKVVDPASWQSYRSFPMFSHRLVVHHPLYGPMVIDDVQHDFFEGICSVVKADEPAELLSIPYPYANYYCGIPPWQGFVQTFFDTSGKAVIDDLIAKLKASPPKWILYQRQMVNLRNHELIYNQGRRLPHRDLDEFIIAKLSSGHWQLVKRVAYGEWSDWLLIKTE